MPITPKVKKITLPSAGDAELLTNISLCAASGATSRASNTTYSFLLLPTGLKYNDPHIILVYTMDVTLIFLLCISTFLSKSWPHGSTETRTGSHIIIIWFGLYPARHQILESRSCLGLSLVLLPKCASVQLHVFSVFFVKSFLTLH